MAPKHELFVSSDVTGYKAVKVRVEVPFSQETTGFHCAGRYWENGITEDTLVGDPGATGVVQIDEATGKVAALYTLQGKLEQLYTLEGRKRIGESPILRKGWSTWSEPRFELPDNSGNNNSKQVLRAGQMARVTILDRQCDDGSWESEKPSPAAIAASAAKAAPQHAVKK